LNEPDDERDPLDRLAEEFLERYRRGERPAVAEFEARASERADQLRELISALLMFEDLRPKRDETVEAVVAPGPVGVPVRMKQLGDYRIIREVGRGGMGVVYEAEQISLSRRVALKVFAPGITRSSSQLQRFVREARSAAQLHHSNIVPVYGVGDQDGLYFFAMQFIDGQALDNVLKEIKRHKYGTDGRAYSDDSATREASPDTSLTAVTQLLASGGLDTRSEREQHANLLSESSGSLPAESSIAIATDSDRRYARSVARIGAQVADALDYAHHHRTLHRDIKPSNLLLDGQGRVWVTDFGLAKAVEDDDLTRTGDLVGTLRYMAPERFRGICDARSDIHALGLTLYELLALRPAFDAPGRDRLIYQVTNLAPPRLGFLNPATPRDLETIIHKAIDPDPAARYRTAGAMARDLRCFLEYRPIEARRVSSTERLTRWARRNPGLATLGTMAAALLAVTVVVIASSNLRLRREQQAALNNLKRAESAESTVVAKYLEASLARASAGRRSGMIGRRFDGLRALQEAAILDTGGTRRPDFRNEAIACLALADLRPLARWPEVAGNERLGLDFDPTGTRIARGLPGGSIEVREISNARLVSSLPGGGLDAVIVRFSRDGHFVAAKHDSGRVEFAVYDVARGRAVLRLNDGVTASAFDFHPDGRRVAAGRRDGTITLYEMATGREVGQMRGGTIPHSIRFDPSGRRIAVASEVSEQAIQVRRVDDGGVDAEWTRPGGAMTLDWHPGGRWLAAGGEDGRIYLLDSHAPKAEARLLERHGQTIVELVFNPSGELLASAAWDGTLRLWHVATGRELVKDTLFRPRRLRFSNDGHALGPGRTGGSACIWEVAEGREYWPVLRGVGPAPIRSIAALPADGLTLAATTAGVMLAAEGAAVSTTATMPGVSAVVANPGSDAIISSGIWGLLRWPVAKETDGSLRIGPPAPLGPKAGEPTLALSLSRDGTTLAAVMHDERGRVMVVDLTGVRSPIDLIEHQGADRVAVSPDGRLVATGTWKGTGVKVWDARRGTVVADLAVPGNASVLFSPEGRWLLTGSSREYALWDVTKWSVIRRFARKQAGGLAGEAAFRDDGRVLALVPSQTLVHLLNPETGSELAVLDSPDPQLITALAFRADGRLLVASSGSDDVRAWDLRTVREELAEIGLDWDGLPEPRKIASDDGSAIKQIVVAAARWLDKFQEGDRLAHEDKWNEAATAYREAIECEAPGARPWTHLAMARLGAGDHSAYAETCRYLLAKFGAAVITPNTANNVAWSCAVAPAALEDYAPAVRLAELGAARNEQNRLNTLGAILYRAGRVDEAIDQLDRSVAAHGAGGTQHDALFLAMAHHRLGHADSARRWLQKAFETPPIATRVPSASGRSSWIPRVEIDVLRREATALIAPSVH
jgi:serine/threonine protein kinase/WD40 repeat protein